MDDVIPGEARFRDLDPRVRRLFVGFGFSALLGAPLRYIVLNEARPEDRGTAQGLLTVFLSVGQLSGAAVIGGVAASRGGGTEGYQLALLILGILTAILVVAGFGLKSRGTERAEGAAAAKV